jgi:teichuronic acid exporter
VNEDISLLKVKALLGARWNAIGQFSTLVGSTAGSICLARILSPNEFGLIAMITVIANLGNIVVAMGLGSAVIQNRTLSNQEISSIFWFNLILGSLVGLIFFFLAGPLADFYNQPEFKENYKDI